MDRLLAITPHFIALVAVVVVAVVIYRRLTTPGAKELLVLVVSEGFWMFGYICELYSETKQGKIFWDNMQYIPFATWEVAIVAFAMAYTDVQWKAKNFLLVLVATPPTIITILMFTDPLHGLGRPISVLRYGEPFGELYYPFNAFVSSAFLLLVIEVALSALWVLLRAFYQPRIFRNQAIVVSIGLFVPAIGMLLTILDVSVLFHRDTSPYYFTLSNIIVLFGLFHFRFLDLRPLARDLIIARSPDPFIVVDATDRIVDHNDAARDFVGILQPGMSISDIIPEFYEQVSGDRGRLTRGVGKGCKHYDCISYDVMGVIRPLGKVWQFRDVTRSVQTEDELIQKMSELEMTNTQLERFAYTLSHDLKSPLRSIIGFSQVAKSDYEVSQEVSDLLDRISASGSRMAKMIDSLLSLAQISGTRIEKSEVDIAEMVTKVFEEESARFGVIHYSVSYDAGQTVFADPILMRVVFDNLIRNAIKFSSKSENPQIQIGSLSEGKRKVFFVSDNGIGFSSTDAEKIFEPFQRLNEGFDGHGIGLATVQTIIRRHDGKIWAEPKADGGARFSFSLP